MKCSFLAACALVLLFSSGLAAQLTSTWNSTTGNWNNAAKWSTANFPNNGNGGFNYIAQVNGGSVTVNQAIIVDGLNLNGGTVVVTNPLSLLNSFNFAGGTISGAGSLTIGSGTSGFQWTGGLLSGTGSTQVGNGTFGGFGNLQLERNLSIGGNVDWIQDAISYSTTAKNFTVASGGTFTSSGSSYRYLHEGNITVSAGGTLVHTNADMTELYADTNFVNNGTIQVNNGTLRIFGEYYNAGSGNSGNGLYSVGSGAVLEFGGGQVNAFSGTVSGAGTTRFSGGTHAINGNYTVAATEVNGGGVAFDGGAKNLGTTTVSSGWLGGSSNLTINQLTWTGGGIDGTGSTTVGGGTFGGLGNVLYLDRNLTIAGSVDWAQDSIYQYNTPKDFTIVSGGTLTSSGNSYRFLQQDNIDINAGGMLIHNNADATEIYAHTNFVNNGSVQVNNGTLRIYGEYYNAGSGSSGNGLYGVSSGAVLEFGGGQGSVFSGTVSGAGTTRFSGGTNTVNGNYTVAATEVSGGIVAFDGGAKNLGTTSVSAGWLGGSSNLTVNQLTWTGGGFDGSGSTTVANGTFGGIGNNLQLDRDMTLVGNVNWMQDNIGYNSVAKDFTLTSGATLTSGGNSYRYFQVDNLSIDAGALLVNNNTDVTEMYTNTSFVNNGTVQVNNGTLRIYGEYFNAGSGSSGNGLYNVSSGAALEFGGGTANAFSGTVSGAGTTRFIGGNNTLNGNYTVAATEVNGGIVAFDGGAKNLGTTAVKAGSLGGSSNLTINQLTWTGGGIDGAGSTTVSGGTFGGLGNNLLLDRSMTLTGNVNWAQDLIYYNSTAKAFNIANGGSLNSNGNSSRYLYVDTLQVDAGGEFVKNGTGVVDVYATVSNQGRIAVNAGTLQLQGNLTNYAGTTLSGGTFDISRTFRFNNTGGIRTNQAELILNGSTALIQNLASTNAIGGMETNGANGILRIRGGKVLGSTRTFTNLGLLEINGPTSRLNLTGTGSTQGQFLQTGGSTHLLDGGSIQTTRGIDVTGGMITGNGDLIVTNGAFNTHFGVNSIVSPGTSAGIIDIQSNTLMEGSIMLELGGVLVDGNTANAGIVNYATNFNTTQFDQLNVFGNLTLANTATLNVGLINGFVASSGDFFDLITANSLTVDLNSIGLNLPSAQYSFQVLTLLDPVNGNVSRDVLRLTYTAVPEPAMLSLVATLLMAIGVSRRYRFAKGNRRER